jgi:MFS family permease
MTSAPAVSMSKPAANPSAYAWVILAVVCIASVASALNQFKVPPVLPVLSQAFNISLSNAGMLMSIFSATGLILALPAAFILRRLGHKITGLIAVGAVCIGSGLGACCTTANAMLASPFIEGAGIGLITIVAPAAIAIWFPVERRGTPLGLWTTCMPVGNIIMFNLAPRLTELAGWQLVWKVGAVLSLAAFVLFWGFSRMPKPEEAGGGLFSSESACVYILQPR